jgi:hypothetical protein
MRMVTPSLLRAVITGAMASRRPFRAVPIERGKQYRRRAMLKEHGTAARLLTAAALAGAAIGAGSVVVTPGGMTSTAAALKPLAVSAGLIRARTPQDGDFWPRCDAARAAGSAPIYAGEPGFRSDLDGDGDGIACEPYPGMR